MLLVLFKESSHLDELFEKIYCLSHKNGQVFWKKKTARVSLGKSIKPRKRPKEVVFVGS